MNKFILVKFNDDWADEMTIQGFWCGLKSEWDDYKTNVLPTFTFTAPPYGNPIDIAIGDNQFVGYYNATEYLAKLTEVLLSDTQFRYFKKIFAGVTSKKDTTSFTWGIFVKPPDRAVILTP